ncbi:methyl-accepting chemotaxis protein [Gemmatimonas groenlandica]|uniref:Methyl-accepting chemotaxis protein n=1 Tax=Gemmatimonas groenlandica TaxID=2732249 RepID=A0A6M4IT29_9BACT|nr:methyl-accepting chemotaxis protein [Gemmatimonas groenlandica]QJR36859.1 methyl-accepting chemotaxis protein [Gemmatimonas groenlandica]
MHTPSAHTPYQALFDEERAKDIATFRIAAKRRFWSTIFIAGVLIAGLRLGLADVSLPAVLAMFCTAIATNWALAAIGASTRWYRSWFKYVFAVFDTALISGVVYLFGSPVLVLTYILAIVPYSFDRGPALGYLTTASSAVGFLIASYAYAQARPADAAPWPQVLLAAVMLVVVAQQVIQMPSKLITRIRRTRERMAQVERGDLQARADARHADELGFLEMSFNRMLDELTLLIDTVQREADELAAVATQVHGAASVMQRRAGDVASGATALSEELAHQRERAHEGVVASQEARRTADTTQQTAASTATHAHDVDRAAAASREAIERAAQALLRVGSDVNATAEQVRLLAPASEQVGDFVATVSRIARQTNLLALNAAIEASRAGDEGLGFAVVADEIRTLAVESAQAAKRIAATVQRVRDDIGAAVLSMDSTADEVAGAGHIARDATQALSALVNGIARISHQSDDVAALAHAQAQLSAGVADAFEALDTSAERASIGARTAADASIAQRASIEELSRSAAQLSQTAARMRAVALRHTSEFATTTRTAEFAALSAATPTHSRAGAQLGAQLGAQTPPAPARGAKSIAA